MFNIPNHEPTLFLEASTPAGKRGFLPEFNWQNSRSCHVWVGICACSKTETAMTKLSTPVHMPQICQQLRPTDLNTLRVHSFGDPNAQPPTPKQTPTSSVFPSSVFETPKNNQGRFDESGGWTPRFAEEYSVFNTTPGNLRGTQGPFPEFVPASPFTPISANQKRPLSAEGLAVEIASHANHFSPNPNLLPPVEPSRQLGSSPSPSFKTPTTNGSRCDHRAILPDSRKVQEKGPP